MVFGLRREAILFGGRICCVGNLWWGILNVCDRTRGDVYLLIHGRVSEPFFYLHEVLAAGESVVVGGAEVGLIIGDGVLARIAMLAACNKARKLQQKNKKKERRKGRVRDGFERRVRMARRKGND